MIFQSCILVDFERTHGRTDGCTDKPKAICCFNFSKVRECQLFFDEDSIYEIKNCILINFERTH